MDDAIAEVALPLRVARFLFSPEPLSLVFLSGMGLVVLWGLGVALRARGELTAKLRQLSAIYANDAEPFNARVPPSEFLHARLPVEHVRTVMETVPAVLLTMGILGTFLGLGLAISDASTALTTPDQAMTAMRELFETVSFKFQTSAWGILLSLAFTVVVGLPTRHHIDARIADLSCTLLGHYKMPSAALSSAVLDALAPAADQIGGSVSPVREAILSLEATAIELQDAVRGLGTIVAGALPELREVAARSANLADELAGVGRKSSEALDGISERNEAALKAKLEEISRAVVHMDEATKKGWDEVLSRTRPSTDQLARALATLGDVAKDLGDSASALKGVASSLDRQTSTFHEPPEDGPAPRQAGFWPRLMGR